MEPNKDLEAAKAWLAANRPHLVGAEIHLDHQDGAHDLHFAASPLLPEVTDAHVTEDPYSVATVTDQVKVEGGIVIPKILKLTLKNGAVSQVLESK